MTMTAEYLMARTEEALQLGADGDGMGAGVMLAPLACHSYGAAYALTGMLAEIASRPGGREQTGPAADGAEAGGCCTVDGLCSGEAFAEQFTTAWARRDHDQAEALFGALVKKSGLDGSDLVNGILHLFLRAVAKSTTGKEPTP